MLWNSLLLTTWQRDQIDFLSLATRYLPPTSPHRSCNTTDPHVCHTRDSWRCFLTFAPYFTPCEWEEAVEQFVAHYLAVNQIALVILERFFAPTPSALYCHTKLNYKLSSTLSSFTYFSSQFVLFCFLPPGRCWARAAAAAQLAHASCDNVTSCEKPYFGPHPIQDFSRK